MLLSSISSSSWVGSEQDISEAVTSAAPAFNVLASIAIVFAIVSIVVSLTVIIGCSISLFHSLREEEKDNTFILFSAIGLTCGILGMILASIFSFVGIIFLGLSIQRDTIFRRPVLYIVVPIFLSIILSIVSILGLRKHVNTFMDLGTGIFEEYEIDEDNNNSTEDGNYYLLPEEDSGKDIEDIDFDDVTDYNGV